MEPVIQNLIILLHVSGGTGLLGKEMAVVFFSLWIGRKGAICSSHGGDDIQPMDQLFIGRGDTGTHQFLIFTAIFFPCTAVKKCTVFDPGTEGSEQDPASVVLGEGKTLPCDGFQRVPAGKHMFFRLDLQEREYGVKVSGDGFEQGKIVLDIFHRVKIIFCQKNRELCL